MIQKRCALLVFALVTRSAIASADDRADAEQLYSVGQAAYDAKQYDDAITAWERSYALSKEPALLFNLGQAYRLRARTGDCAKASSNYQRFAALDAKSDQRPVAEGFIANLRTCVASTEAAPPRSTSRRTTSKQVAGIAIAGGGVVAIGIGLYFGHRASVLGDEVTTACASGCDWATYGPTDASGRSAQTKAYIFDAIGGAAMAGGAVLYLLGSRERAPGLVVTARHDGAGIAWGSAW